VGKCQARLTLQDDGRYVMYGDHNHEDEEEEIKKMAVENACKDRVALDNGRPKLIFETIRAE